MRILKLIASICFLVLISACSIDLPSVIKVNIKEVVETKDKLLSSTILLEVYNPNTSDLEITVQNFQVFSLSSEELPLILNTPTESVNTDFLNNKAPIGSIGDELKLNLPSETNTSIELKILLERNQLFKNSLLLLLYQKINLLFKGRIVFHHWSGNYETSILKHYELDLRDLLK